MSGFAAIDEAFRLARKQNSTLREALKGESLHAMASVHKVQESARLPEVAKKDVKSAGKKA